MVMNRVAQSYGSKKLRLGINIINKNQEGDVGLSGSKSDDILRNRG